MLSGLDCQHAWSSLSIWQDLSFYVMNSSMLQIKTGAQQESIFNAVCEYKLICDIPFPDCEPYPFVSDTNWGPGKL